MKKFVPISPNVINRMPKYLRCLHRLHHNGLERTSSAQIAQIMGTTPSQVRQDLSAFGSFGSQGYGYNIEFLIGEIHKILGLNHKHEIAVIGVGGIGRALLEHMEFEYEDSLVWLVLIPINIAQDIAENGTEGEFMVGLMVPDSIKFIPGQSMGLFVKGGIVCEACSGTGSCMGCGGTGRFRTIDGYENCSLCDGTGICQVCDGMGSY